MKQKRFKYLLLAFGLITIILILSSCMPPTYSVSGYVTDTKGNGISGVTISFSDGLPSVITALNGSWSQSGLSGNVSISAYLNGYSFYPPSISVSGADNSVNFTAYYSVSGEVYDQNGDPIPGVTISFSDSSISSVMTDSNGYWSQTGLSGSVIVTPSLPGYSFNPSSVTVSGPENNIEFIGIAIHPNIPSNPIPYNGQTGVATNITLSWIGGGPNGDTINYDVYFGTSFTPPLVQSNLTSTSYTPGRLSYSTTYYWQIVAVDTNTGLTATSAVWSFTTEPQPAPSTYSVSGRIVDINGNGISGVTISFSDSSISSVMTDSNGYWSQTGLSGSVIVTPSLSGYTFVPSSINVTGTNNNVNFSGYLNVSGNMSITNWWPLSVQQNGQNVIGQIYSSPAISTDGTIFVGGAGGLFSVQSNTVNYVGGISNSSNSLVNIWSSPAVDPNNDDVFVGTNNGYLISTQYPFSSIWYIPVSQSQISIIGAPLCFNGNVYVVNALGDIYEMSEISMSTYLIATLENNGYFWASPITNGIDLFIGNTGGTFSAINLVTGQTDWTYSIGQQQILSTAAIGPNGNIYFAGTNLYSLTPTGQLRWSVNLDGSQVKGSPVVSANGIVYIGTSAGNFYAINSSNGSILWQDNLSTSIGGISNSALIGNNGVIYVASGWILYALNAGTGAIVSSIGLGYNIDSSPVMNDGYIYVGCDDGYLYQIQALSTNISSGGWPMFMRNWYHTGLW